MMVEKDRAVYRIEYRIGNVDKEGWVRGLVDYLDQTGECNIWQEGEK